MKRLAGLNDPGEKRRTALLVCLAVAALISIVGTVATVFGLRGGVAELESGLERLETDLDFELPSRPGELGRISKSVNRVAAARRRLEAELHREHRLRAIGRLATNFAHEIRNPLNSIRLTMQMLKQKVGRAPIGTEDLNLVIDEVDRLNTLLTELLAFRQKGNADLEPQPLVPIIDRCVQLTQAQASEKGVEINLRAAEANFRAPVDPAKLTQVVTNLLLNSIASISGHGSIDIDVHRNGRSATIDIRDTGPGVAAEHREHIFDAFYTTRRGGSGLGLWVSRELMQSMGGTLTYRDGSPGAIFSLSLPDDGTAS
ncbi:MAG: hypothetical protein JOZ62_06840 [Acidobacteriaceae bacterium]|nr:hypothetical protein [Acidobacteriaceae bacterium]